MGQALSDTTAGNKVSGESNQSLRCAHGALVIAENIKDVQRMMDRIVVTGETNDLH